MIFLLPLIFVGYSYIHSTLVGASDNNGVNVGFVVLSQANEYHNKLFQKKHKEILNQAKAIKNQLQVKIFKSYDLLDNDAGHWTIFPLLEKLSTFKSLDWIFFCEELTEINLKYLYGVFQKYNSSEDIFVGFVLQDSDASIIHHFADPNSLLYPHFSAGFFISSSLLHRLVTKLPVDDEYSFSIDPKYEFAKFVWDSGNGAKVQHEEQLCLIKTSESCATWIENEFPDCGLPLQSETLHIGIKTCHKFHADRIVVVKNTWAKEGKNIIIFSDRENHFIPTIKVNVENVAHGHCEKTLSILKYYVENNVSLEWLAIVDDDTIISIKRLRKLLTCYNASDTVIIGERYGYGVAYGSGYDYITGGGGMIFSFSAIKLLTAYCQCPSIDSPDDMIIGMCLKRLEIPVTHSPYFHQARPTDYSPQFLKPFKHISFHKHWMINPYSVYQEWLQDPSDVKTHTEL